MASGPLRKPSLNVGLDSTYPRVWMCHSLPRERVFAQFVRPPLVVVWETTSSFPDFVVQHGWTVQCQLDPPGRFVRRETVNFVCDRQAEMAPDPARCRCALRQVM